MVKVQTPKKVNTPKTSVWTKGTEMEGIVKPLPQSGFRRSVDRDKSRKARVPGKRVSKTGKVYWETRKNRSDKIGTRL